MNNKIKTERLSLTRLSEDDAGFILNLLNTPEWIANIGNRNIHNLNDAVNYINKISAIDNYYFWTVKTSAGTPIGIITFLKKDYLPHPDIGFAFLPEFSGKGYAYEAANATLNMITGQYNITNISAVTIKENIRSISLLKKLGLEFQHTITIEGEELLLFLLPDNTEKQGLARKL